AIKLARRYPVVGALCALVLLVAILGYVGISYQWGQAVAERDRSRLHEQAALIARDDANYEKQLAISYSKEADAAKVQALAAKEQADTAKEQAVTAKELAETNVYFSRVAQARLEWDLEYNLNTANLLLEKSRPASGQVDRRGWEWHYLKGLLRGE